MGATREAQREQSFPIVDEILEEATTLPVHKLDFGSFQ